MNATPKTIAVAAETSRTRRWTRELRLRTFRRLVPNREPGTRAVEVRIAETADERAAAFRLLHDEYVRSGLTDVEESGMRVTPYHSLPTTRVFIALKEGVVVGTLSLIQRSYMGVPCETLFDLTALSEREGVIEELSSLAVARSAAGDGEIMFCLFKAVVRNGRSRSVKHWVITCHPRHRYLYEEILGFEPLAERQVRSYDFVNGAPAVGAHLDLKLFPRTLAERYGADTARTPYTWFFGEDESPLERVA